MFLHIFSTKSFVTHRFVSESNFDHFGNLFVLGSSNFNDEQHGIHRRIDASVEDGFGKRIWFSKSSGTTSEVFWSKSSRDDSVEYSYLSDVASHPLEGIRVFVQEVFFYDNERVRLGNTLVGHVSRNGDFLWQGQVVEKFLNGSLLGVAIESDADGSVLVLGDRESEGRLV